MHQLEGSYRLPSRVCECVRPLAEEILRQREAQDSEESRDTEHDVGLPTAKKPAVLGSRPIIVSKSQLEESLPEIFAVYRRQLELAPSSSREITIAEGGIDPRAVQKVAPHGYRVRRDSMRVIKGLERACVIWPTWHPAPSEESDLEWAYTIITRTTGLVVIAVDANTTLEHSARVLALLRDDRLLLWDEEAQSNLQEILGRESGSAPFDSCRPIKRAERPSGQD
jgi:hypothetical protein